MKAVVEVQMECSACNFEGPHEECEVCGGDVQYTRRVEVEVDVSHLEREASHHRARAADLVADKVKLQGAVSRLVGAVEELNYRLSHTDRPQGFVGHVEDAKRVLSETGGNA